MIKKCFHDQPPFVFLWYSVSISISRLATGLVSSSRQEETTEIGITIAEGLLTRCEENYLKWRVPAWI